MIKFKDLATADKQLIQSYTLWGERQNCDLSFANLISWRFLYNTQFAIVDDYLVFRFHYNRHLAYMMPVAKPQLQEDGTYKVKPCDECSINVIKAIRDDSFAMGHPFLLMGVCNYMRDLIELRFPNTFEIKPNRDFADYIYTREKLINLKANATTSISLRTFTPIMCIRNLHPTLSPNVWHSKNNGETCRKTITTRTTLTKDSRKSCAR